MRTPQAKSARPEKTVLFKWGKDVYKRQSDHSEKICAGFRG